jgi:hypothetical protein
VVEVALLSGYQRHVGQLGADRHSLS